jgi:rubrerythrin
MGSEQVQWNEGRRQFLARAGVATLGIGATGLLGGRALAAPAAQAGDVGVIQTALALEHEGIAAYQIAGKSGLLSPATLKLALLFLGHHEAHRDSLAALVGKAGGKPVEPKTDSQYISDLNLGVLKSENDVVALATRLERGAASAYIGQITALKDPALARLFAEISADEAIHWTTLNNAAGTPIPESAYVFA